MSKSNSSIKNLILKKNKKVLFTPGPASLLKENIIGLEPCFGRGDIQYDKIEKFVLSKIKKITGHEKIARFQGSGSLALEIMTLNFLYGSVLIIKSGYYSDRLYNMAISAKNNYNFIKKIIYIDIKDAEKLTGSFDWVYSCYTETSRGIKLPIKKLKKISKKLKSKLMLDATASVGLEDNHDLADVIGFSSCKGLFGLTGGSFICYNQNQKNEINSFYLNLENHLNKKMTGPYHTICSLYEVLKRHDDFKQSVFVNKKKFLRKFSNYIVHPLDLQPNICTYSKKKIFKLKKNIILYKSRGDIKGSIVSHLGEVHLGKKANGKIVNSIK